MKTFSLTELRRDPLPALRAVGKGHDVRVTRRAAVIAEIKPLNGSRPNPMYDPAFLKLHEPPRPRRLKRGEAGVVELLRQDRDER